MREDDPYYDMRHKMKGKMPVEAEKEKKEREKTEREKREEERSKSPGPVPLVIDDLPGRRLAQSSGSRKKL